METSKRAKRSTRRQDVFIEKLDTNPEKKNTNKLEQAFYFIIILIIIINCCILVYVNLNPEYLV